MRAEVIYRLHRPRRILFDHLPKCAGTTVRQYLTRHYPTRVTFVTDGVRPDRSVAAYRSLADPHRYELIVGHLTHDLLDVVHPDTLATTVLRDPVERIASHYQYVLDTPAHYLHDRARGMSLAEYATSGLSDELNNWYSAHFGSGDPSEAARLITEKYALVGFQDDLVSFLAALQGTARLLLSPPRLRLNASNRRPEIRSSDRRIISAVNSADVYLYGLLRAQS